MKNYTIMNGKETTLVSSRRGRSRVTNGRDLFLGNVDRRSARARRFADLYDLILADLGGEEATSIMEKILCRRAAFLAMVGEEYEAELASGGEVDMTDAVRLIGCLKRVLETIGLKRRPRDITPSLDQYLASRRGTNGRSRRKVGHG